MFSLLARVVEKRYDDMSCTLYSDHALLRFHIPFGFVPEQAETESPSNQNNTYPAPAKDLVRYPHVREGV